MDGWMGVDGRRRQETKGDANAPSPETAVGDFPMYEHHSLDHYSRCLGSCGPHVPCWSVLLAHPIFRRCLDLCQPRSTMALATPESRLSHLHRHMCTPSLPQPVARGGRAPTGQLCPFVIAKVIHLLRGLGLEGEGFENTAFRVSLQDQPKVPDPVALHTS